MNENMLIIRHTYKVHKALKVYSIYEIVEVTTSKNPLFSTIIDKNRLTDLIRIEDFRGFSKANNIDEYLRIRTTTNWSTCEKVTGLFKTSQSNIFYGDRLINGVRNLIVFVFDPKRENLTINIYVGYYPHKCGIDAIIQTLV